jgi:DNA-binding MarR family transcriptional regulator
MLLLAAARQSGIGDPDSCGTILSLLSASRAVRRALGRELGFQDDSGSRFAALITLYALNPEPVTAADLANHAEVSRSTIMKDIETLERRGLVGWGGGGRDRIAPIHLTEFGHRVAMRAVHRFLQVASDLARDFDSEIRNATVETCRQIERRAAGPAS